MAKEKETTFSVLQFKLSSCNVCKTGGMGVLQNVDNRIHLIEKNSNVTEFFKKVMNNVNQVYQG